MRKLTKARDRYYKRCQNELSQPLPDTKQMKVDKDNYWSQLVLANNSLKLFYSFDLPKHLESAEKALLARVDGVQNCIRRIVGVKKTSCESLGACNVLVLDAISATGDAKGDLSALAHKYNKESVPFQTIPQFVYQEYSSTALSRAAPVPEANVPEELVLGRPRRKSGPEPDLVKILFESDSSPPQIGTKKNDLPLGDGKDPHQQQTAPLAVAAPAVAKDNVNSDNVNSCNKKVFGVSLNELMERQKRRKDGGAEKEEEEEEEEEERLPVIAKYFVESLLRMKVEAVPSIFKRGGKALTVAELKKGIDNGVLTPLTDPYVCADVFKFWIRSLPEPLIPNTL